MITDTKDEVSHASTDGSGEALLGPLEALVGALEFIDLMFGRCAANGWSHVRIAELAVDSAEMVRILHSGECCYYNKCHGGIQSKAAVLPARHLQVRLSDCCDSPAL